MGEGLLPSVFRAQDEERRAAGQFEVIIFFLQVVLFTAGLPSLC